MRVCLDIDSLTTTTAVVVVTSTLIQEIRYHQINMCGDREHTILSATLRQSTTPHLNRHQPPTDTIDRTASGRSCALRYYLLGFAASLRLLLAIALYLSLSLPHPRRLLANRCLGNVPLGREPQTQT